ncbi:MAG: ATP-binding protein [Cyanobium sp. CZS 48M]|nr:ATP-binding protein [Cyanobium sp. CZS48M]
MSSEDLQEQLRRTLGRLEAALSSVEDALVLTDFNGRVEWTNRAFNLFVGQSRLLSLGRLLDDLLPPHFIDGIQETPRDLLDGARLGPGSLLWDLTPTPPRRVVEVKWSPVNLKPDPSLVFVFRDLTEITRAQDQITKARDTLEQDVAARTLELQQARDEALAATGAMGQFLSTISHEIRTPLNAVIGMSDLLLDTSLDGQQKELVHTINSSAELLLRLINDILDLSKIEAKKMKISSEAFSLRSLVLDCCRMMDAAVRAKRLELRCSFSDDPPDALIGDGLRIRQIVLNLLNNAIKFTSHGSVGVKIGWRPLTPSTIELDLVVDDTGTGISEDFLSKIFQDFTQEHNQAHASHHHGTGLGLAICDRLCRLMGGRIEAMSQLGQGSRFHVRLPLERSEPEAPSASGSDQPLELDLSSVRLLAVEDNRINQRVLELLLAKLNLQAEFADCGEDAVERLGQGGFNLVLMDLQMPGIDGLEATRQLRALPIPQPYVVALTAFAFEDQQQECLAAGMQDFLTKPVRVPALQGCLQRFLHWQSLQQGRSALSAGTPPSAVLTPFDSYQ